MSWTVRIGQGGSIRTQARVVDVRVTEEFAHQEFVVTIKNPTATDRAQAKGRVDAAIIEIKRGSDTLIEGFIEDIEKGPSIIKYIGRSFLVLTGYTTSSLTDGTSGVTKAEYDGDTGAVIIDDLLDTFCYVNDNELVYTDLTFTEVYGGEVKLHGKKVYDVIRNMCIDHSKDLWADATWTGDNVTAKNIHVGTKSRGSVGAPNKTLYGGVHLKNIPTVKYRSSQNVINRIRVNGKGSGKDKVSVVVNDATSQTTYGVIEGAPYNNNMIVDEATATTIGEAIIAAKKDLVEEIHVDLIQYLSDLKYGDWVRIVDSYSFVDTTQRIKKITRSYNNQNGESIAIEVGMPFDNYETLIKDLTKGDVDAEPEMTKLGGAFIITANDPVSTYVRHDKGDWYDTTGTFQSKTGKGVCAFWTGADNPATNAYKKALIQISNTGVVSYKVGTQYASKATAEAEVVSADALNTPIGEVILKGKSGSPGDYVVEDVYSKDPDPTDPDDSTYSYIYRDVRPIVGSSSSGYGGENIWEKTGDPEYTRLITAQDIDLRNKGIWFEKGVSNTRIYPSGDNLIINPTSTASSIGLGGILSALYGIINCDGITMYDSGSILDMNYGSIVDSDDITLYDGGSVSPKLSLKVPLIESAGGAYLQSTDNVFDINKISGGVLAQCTMDTGEWYFLGPIKSLGDINVNNNDLINVDKIKAYFSTGIDIADSAGADKITLATTTYALEALANVNMAGYDIINADKIQGTSGTPMKLEFKGTTAYRIYVDGTTPYYTRYETLDAHEFDVATNPILYITPDGIYMATGKKITNLAAGTNASDAVRFDQLGGGYEHPSARQCTTGNWAWASITGKPAYTTRWAAWTEVTSKPSTFTPSDHSTDKLTSGILAVARGGTGVSGDTYDADKVDGCHAGGVAGDVWKLYSETYFGGIYTWAGAPGMAYITPGTDGYQLTTHGNDAAPTWSDISLLRDGSRDMTGNLKLYDGTSISPKLSLKVPFIESAGGVFLQSTDNVFDINKISGGVLAQCTIDTGEWYFVGPIKTLGDINVNNNDLINVDKIKAYFSTGIDIADSAGADKITLATTSYAFSAAANVDMNHNDIIDCRNIKGDTSGTDGSDRLNLDFRGDANHRIYYTGSSDNRLGYKTSNAHAFAIGANVIAQIDANGLIMQTGKHIKSASGDLELRAPSGSKIKFVIG